MQPYIDAVKASVMTIATKMKSIYANLDLQLAFVRYTDYDIPEHRRTTSLNFTRDVKAFERYVGKIRAEGGDDFPEDVFGGLHHALFKLDWGTSKNTNILIHIADAPCHGDRYHDYAEYDAYPKGDPAKISFPSLMCRVIDLRLSYWFGRISHYTDKMISKFNAELERQDSTFPSINTFAALEDPMALAKSVTSAAIESVTATMAALNMNTSTLREFKLDPSRREYVNWPAIPAFKAAQLMFKLPNYESLTSVQSAFEEQVTSIYVKVAPQPFAVGALRLAYHAKLYVGSDLDERNSKHIVLKLMKHVTTAKDLQQRYIQEMEAATVAAKLANDYNNMISSRRIKASQFTFGVVKIAKFATDPTDHSSSSKASSKASSSTPIDRTIFNLEPYIEGKYEKFTTNSGFIEDSDLAREFSCFSHWTYAKTSGKVMVVDLQGVNNERGIFFTDPAVHSTNLHRFGKTNLGPDGFARFFKTHSCSELCYELGIQNVKI